MQKQWKVNKKPPKRFFEQFPEYSRMTLQLLWDRGLKTQKAIDEFFNVGWNSPDEQKVEEVEEEEPNRRWVAICSSGVLGESESYEELARMFKGKDIIITRSDA